MKMKAKGEVPGACMQLAPVGSMPRILFYTAIYGLACAFYPSYSSSYTNTAAVPLRLYINESYVRRGEPGGLGQAAATWLWSLVLNALFLGFLIATPFVPTVTDRLGRRLSLLIGTGLQVVACCVDTLAIICFLPELFLLSRVLGNCVNMLVWASVILVVIESAPNNLRGTCMFLLVNAWSTGQLTGMVLGMGSVLGEQLPLLTGAGVVPALAAFLMSWPLKETPKFLICRLSECKAHDAQSAKSLLHQALDSLYFYQGLSGEAASKVVQETLKEPKDDDATSSSSGDSTPKQHARLTFAEKLSHLLTRRHLRRAVLLGTCAMLLSVGIYPITTQLLAVHFGQAHAQLLVSLLAVVNLVSGLLGIFLVHKMRRRVLLIGSGLLSLCSLLAYIAFDRLASWAPIPASSNSTTTHFQVQFTLFAWFCLAAMTFYYVAISVGFGKISVSLSGELLPQSYRSTGQSCAFFVTHLSLFTFNFVTLPAYEAWNVWVFIPAFAIPQALCLIYLWRSLPETRNREIRSIVAELMRK